MLSFTFSILLLLSFSVYLTYLTGVLNIVTEGFFLWAVFSAFFLFSSGVGLFVALLGTAVSTGLLMFLFYGLHFGLKINENFVGILLNVSVSSALELINTLGYGKQGVLYFESPIHNLTLFRGSVFGLAIGLVLLIGYGLFRTSWGIRLRLASAPDLWKWERGLNPSLDRVVLLGASVILISCAGVFLLISLNAYTVGLGKGMGWLALFALLLGFSRLWGVISAAGFLSLVLSLSYYVQETLGFYFSAGLPYFLAFGVYLILSWWQVRRKRDL